MEARRTDDFAAQRAAMVGYLGREIRDERVLSALAAVPRERFVPPDLRSRAYDNTPLPIGYGQTISQPLVVAIMLEALDLRGGESVLDIGTGSGYQAALLCLLAREVVSVERIPELAAGATAALDELRYGNVRVHIAGRLLGWPAGAPYDAIIAGAAAPSLPDALLTQLAVGGRLVMPVGGPDEQRLMVVRKDDAGASVSEGGACRFVPLIGEGAFAPGHMSN
ncbi:MAG TPA: protein-L-isoaspartate(D-aspartate) O-methyltransferase [Dehalococcoidia bacterium]|jgi:protein-L-isoaspartate(D-aspartate) O-methyltransferase